MPVHYERKEEILQKVREIQEEMEAVRAEMAPLQGELSAMYGKFLRQQHRGYAEDALEKDDILRKSQRLDMYTERYILLDMQRIALLRELEIQAGD